MLKIWNNIQSNPEKLKKQEFKSRVVEGGGGLTKNHFLVRSFWALFYEPVECLNYLRKYTYVYDTKLKFWKNVEQT